MVARGCRSFTRQGRFENLSKIDGLIDDEVASLAAGANGELWIGTWFHGLSRYDGRNFSELHHGIGPAHERCLVRRRRCEGQGVARHPRGGLVGYDGRRIDRYTTTNGLASDTILKVLPTSAVSFGSAQTTAWPIAEGRLRLTRGAKTACRTMPSPDSCRMRDGVLWIGAPGGVHALRMAMSGPP